MANGATWFVVTRLRHSMRRSLPATSAASRNTEHRPGRCPRPASFWRRSVRISGVADARTSGSGVVATTVPPAMVTVRSAMAPARSSSWDATTTVAPAAAADADEPVDRRRGRPGRARRGARRAATARCGGRPARRWTSAGAGRPTAWPPRRRRGGRRGRARRGRRRPRPGVAPQAWAQKRTLSATVRSSYSPVAWPSSPTRRRTARAVGGLRRSQPSTIASPETTGSEARAGAQQRGLAGAVRALDEHDLASLARRDRRRRERETGRAARPRRGNGRPGPL